MDKPFLTDCAFFYQGAYQLSAGGQQDLFQAAHTTYGRMTPPGQNSFAQHNHNDSEAMPAYSTIATDNGAQIITASTVDSSTLQQVGVRVCMCVYVCVCV